jgi:hypothetical protein
MNHGNKNYSKSHLHADRGNAPRWSLPQDQLYEKKTGFVHFLDSVGPGFDFRNFFKVQNSLYLMMKLEVS